jgi:hypothetical protein
MKYENVFNIAPERFGILLRRIASHRFAMHCIAGTVCKPSLQCANV